jgi:hypothetical protein
MGTIVTIGVDADTLAIAGALTARVAANTPYRRRHRHTFSGCICHSIRNILGGCTVNQARAGTTATRSAAAAAT